MVGVTYNYLLFLEQVNGILPTVDDFPRIEEFLTIDRESSNRERLLCRRKKRNPVDEVLNVYRCQVELLVLALIECQ